ncbi:MAG TPA: NAD(P)H-dependent glycerol-3-phosphate dehydrogenase [Alphaproteobacteria bacterium]|nr:NAD(P)H-dependent glycerol-3-phosphate dehydrogenase [Alphaproteobacteria bacterium]
MPLTPEDPIRRIAVIGGGAWGTALATVARRAGREVVLWARDPKVVDAVNADHANPAFLPGLRLDPAIRATTDPAEALAGAEAVLLVVPSQFLRGVVRRLGAHVPARAPLVICAKGIEAGTGLLMSEMMAEELPGRPLAVLSGPTFAAEVAQGLPTAITLATAESIDRARTAAASTGARLVLALGTPSFRPYLSDDLIGAEVGGAVKNVLAIACGIAEGRGMGANTRASLITRGIAEIARLAAAKGGRPQTLMGLSGLGDLTLTCSNTQSRNMSFGLALGRGETREQALAGRRAVVEGIANAASVTALARRLGVDMPICAAVDAILHHGMPIDDAIRGLLDRPWRAEPADLDLVLKPPRPL